MTIRRVPNEQAPSSEIPLKEWLSRLIININSALASIIDMSYTHTDVTGSITTNGRQVLICRNTSSIDVTLELAPPIGTEVHVKRKDAEVIVKGPIDGVVDKTINIVNYSMHLYYDGIEWSEI